MPFYDYTFPLGANQPPSILFHTIDGKLNSHPAAPGAYDQLFAGQPLGSDLALTSLAALDAVQWTARIFGAQLLTGARPIRLGPRPAALVFGSPYVPPRPPPPPP